jgi:putative ATP-dependent endonuclease of OLD family
VPPARRRLTSSNTYIMFVGMLQLTHLTVNNFRSIGEGRFDLSDLCILIGKNDVGKSNLLHAVRLLLSGTSSSVALTDFYELSKRIEIEARFAGASDFLALCDEKNRKKVSDRICDDGSLRIRRCTDENSKLGKIETFDPRDGNFSTPTGIDAALRPILPEVIFIGALADVSQEAEGTKKGAVGQLMSQILNRGRDRIEPHLTSAYAGASELLNIPDLSTGKSGQDSDSRIQELKDVEGRISFHLKEMFPSASARLKINLPTADDIFRGVDVLIKEGICEEPYYRRGHGLQRALHLSLLRSLAFYIRQEQEIEVPQPFILLFEEPEAFLHPSGQTKMRDALAEIAKKEQVIIATHSPVLVSARFIDKTMRLEKTSPGPYKKPVTRAYGPIDPTKLEQKEKEIHRLFEIQRSARFLFSRGVLLVEGVADEHLVSAAGKMLKGFDFDFHEIAIVESGGKDAIIPFMSLLRKLQLKTWALVDLDFLWAGAGQVLKSDALYSEFCEQLDAIVPKRTAPATDHEKRVDKQSKTEVCVGELRKLVSGLADRLADSSIYLLSNGEIELYFGMSASGKGHYMQAASGVLTGNRVIAHPEDLLRLFDALEKWSMETRL